MNLHAPSGDRLRLSVLMWLWLVLVTIAAHAILPIGSPIARSSGSAFSATTIDVALAPKRHAASGEVVSEASAGGEAAAFGASGDAAELPSLPFGFGAVFLGSRGAAPVPLQAHAASEPARAFRARAPPAA